MLSNHPSKLTMTSDKAKSSSPSRWQAFINEALFIKRFHHSSDLSPDAIREQLEALAFQRDKLTRVFFPRRRIVKIDRRNGSQANLDITTKLGGLYTEIRATGHIQHDEATHKTTLTGAVKFDAVYLTILLIGLFFLITWAIAGLSRTGSLPSPFLLFTLGLTNLYYFRQMFIDRNDLLQTLSQTVMASDVSSARKRLSIRDTESEAVDIDDLSQYKVSSQETS